MKSIPQVLADVKLLSDCREIKLRHRRLSRGLPDFNTTPNVANSLGWLGRFCDMQQMFDYLLRYAFWNVAAVYGYKGSTDPIKKVSTRDASSSSR
jgi:hypothetical protein